MKVTNIRMQEEPKDRWTEAIVRGFGNEERRLEIRPLRFEEVHGLLRLARDSDWYGNAELITYVTNAGVRNAETALGDGAFTATLAAREIWILTLRTLLAQARAIARAANTPLPRLRVRRYRYEDLATPGMLLRVADKCEEFNVQGFLEDMVDQGIEEVRIGDRTLDEAERLAKIAEFREPVARTLLETHGVQGDLSDKLPATIFPTFAHRFFAANQLFMTLDWVQFRDVMYAFNLAVDGATRRSHELGGLDMDAARRLVTAVPMFFETVMPTQHLPYEIAPQLLHDATRTKLAGFSWRDRTILRAAAKKAWRAAAARVRDCPDQDNLSESDRGEIVYAAAKTFVDEVSRKPRLVRRICVTYAEQFRSHSDRRIRSHVEDVVRDMKLFDRPDSYFLVEGPSDEIYLSRCFELVGTGDAYLKVEKQEGTSSIDRRLRDLKKDGAHSILTLVDADAPGFHEDLKRLLAAAPYCDAYILPRGMIEDQFSAELHAAALNATYPDGEEVVSTDLANDGDIVNALKRVTWEKKQARFDKVAHARVLSALLPSAANVPAELRRIVDAAVAHAERCHRDVPRPKSYLSLDRGTLEVMRAWQRARSNERE